MLARHEFETEWRLYCTFSPKHWWFILTIHVYGFIVAFSSFLCLVKFYHTCILTHRGIWLQALFGFFHLTCIRNDHGFMLAHKRRVLTKLLWCCITARNMAIQRMFWFSKNKLFDKHSVISISSWVWTNVLLPITYLRNVFLLYPTFFRNSMNCCS